MWGGGCCCAVEAAFVEVDQPELAGRAHNEVAEVSVAEAHAQIKQPLPQIVKLLPQAIADGRRLPGFAGEIGAERAAFDKGIH